MSAAPHRPSVLEPPVAPAPVPSLPQEPRSSRRWLVLLVIVLALVAVFFVARRMQQQAEPAPAAVATIRTAVATTGVMEHVIRVSGQTSAIDFSNLIVPILRGPDSSRELILLSTAAPGSWVRKGDIVAQIDAQGLVDHVEDLDDTIKTAEADIRKRQAEQAIEMENLMQSLRVAKADVDKARLEYGASETLTDIQRQLLKLTLDETEGRYKQLQADVGEKKTSHAADIKILEYTLLRHTRHRDRHKRDIQAFTIRAGTDGLVVMQQLYRGGEMAQIQIGDRLSPGQPFMKIVNTSKMQVEGTINQAESSDFRVGQPARIKFDAFPELQFDGKVHSIGALASGGYRNSYYVRTVPIRISIQGSDPKLIPDLSAAADVTVQSLSDQVLVPLSAVRTENDKTVAYVKSGEKFERREVTIGERNANYAAIVSGVQAGETVQIN